MKKRTKLWLLASLNAFFHEVMKKLSKSLFLKAKKIAFYLVQPFLKGVSKRERRGSGRASPYRRALGA
jgi:hypothetical protein